MAITIEQQRRSMLNWRAPVNWTVLPPASGSFSGPDRQQLIHSYGWQGGAAPHGSISIKLAGDGGLAGPGGLSGRHGGLVG